MTDALLDAAKDVVIHWDAWLQAPGWNNEEYDEFSEALCHLECVVKMVIEDRAAGNHGMVHGQPT